MSAVIQFGAFGDPEAIRAAQVGNATYSLAIDMGHSRRVARALADRAKRFDTGHGTASEVAARIVEPPHTPRGPGPGGGSPGTGVAA